MTRRFFGIGLSALMALLAVGTTACVTGWSVEAREGETVAQLFERTRGNTERGHYSWYRGTDLGTESTSPENVTLTAGEQVDFLPIVTLGSTRSWGGETVQTAVDRARAESGVNTSAWVVLRGGRIAEGTLATDMLAIGDVVVLHDRADAILI